MVCACYGTKGGFGSLRAVILLVGIHLQVFDLFRQMIFAEF
jgi:hypothetical protein